MPFLVDSVVMELTRQQRDVHLVIHPQFDVTRDVTGRLERIACPDNESAEPLEGAARESWMHVEISRIGHDEDLDAIVNDLQRVLARRPRVRGGLGPDARSRSSEIVDELARRPAAVDPAGRDRPWRRVPELAGRRPLHASWATASTTSTTRATASTSAACPAPGSASCATTPTCRRRRSASCPDKAAECASEQTLLVLAKANSRSTVHRPAYLDYVGREDVRRGRRGHRRASLPRPVLQRRLHRVGLARPAAAREGQGRPATDRARPPQPRRQGADRHPRDLPARRAVPHSGRRARHDVQPGDGDPRPSAAAASSYVATPTAATSASGVPAP